jgi:hypothetical protein
MSFKRLSLALAGILAVALTQQVAAQAVCTGSPCSVNNTASVNVQTVLKLTLTSITTTLTSPNEAAFDQGWQDDAGPTATVKSNRPWNLTIAAQAAVWTGANGGRATKPAGDLQWKVGAGSFAGLTTSAADVLTSQPASAGTPTAFSYRTLWAYTADTPGDYSLVVVYTVTAP